MSVLKPMKPKRMNRLLVLVLFCLLQFQVFAQEAQTVFKNASPSVMTLTVTIKGGGTATGTGFLAIKEGVAVTAWHVISDAESVVAKFADGQEYEVSGLIDKDEKRDIAIVRVKVVDRPMLNFITKDPEIGSKAYVLGAPEGLDFSITDGIVSQLRTLDGTKQYQYSAPTNQGNSGGPVLNSDSEVLGVVSYGLRNTAGLYFAVASVNVRGLDSSLPTQPWVTVRPSSPTSSRNNLAQSTLLTCFSNAMNRLWQMAVQMQVETEDLMRSKFEKLSPLFSEADINLKVASDVLDSALSTNESRSSLDSRVEYFNDIIKMAILTAEQLAKCSEARKQKGFEGDLKKFVTAFRITEVSNDQLLNLKNGSESNLVRSLGPLLATKIMANPMQTGWRPGEMNRTSRMRFEGGFKLIARLAFDIDSTGYVFGFLVDPNRPNRIFETQGGTPPHGWGFRKGDIVQEVNGNKVPSIEMMKQVILNSERKEGWVIVNRDRRLVKLKLSFRQWT